VRIDSWVCGLLATAERVGVIAGVLMLALAAWQVLRFSHAIIIVRRVNEWAERTEIMEGLAEREGQDRLIGTILDALLPGRYHWAPLLLALASLLLTTWRVWC
jgi:hypothetical protein